MATKKAAVKAAPKAKAAPSKYAATAEEVNKVVDISAALGKDDATIKAALVEAIPDIAPGDPLSPEAWAVMTELGWKAPKVATAATPPPAGTKAPKAGKAAKAPKAKKEPKGPGVIATIVTILSKGKHTKAEIVEKLAKAFPDRKADSMKSTVNVQLPTRLAKEKKVKIQQDDKGHYWIA